MYRARYHGLYFNEARARSKYYRAVPDRADPGPRSPSSHPRRTPLHAAGRLVVVADIAHEFCPAQTQLHGGRHSAPQIGEVARAVIAVAPDLWLNYDGERR